ncbi:MAG: M15 family metallopeptidase [Alphaproteobacteria bacterium]|nr:M15 family metallopeptidase [Alphaproteobacteria bacterium]
MKLNDQSLKKLQGIHPDLRRVVMRAAEHTPIDFIVTEGVRTMRRQRELVESGASQTFNSRHLTGHAIDFAPVIGGEITWKWPPFRAIARNFKEAAQELGIAIAWGGDWRDFKDGPHIELDRRVYRS